MTSKPALTICAALLLPAAANAATIEVTSGSGQRSLAIGAFDPLGQIFTAADISLQSFGFQLQTLNAGQPNGALTLTLRAGGGFDGAILATRQLTPSGIPASRTPTWLDFDFTGTMLGVGQTYTALLTSDSLRYGLIYGPDINLSSGQPLGGDAYVGGRFIATNLNNNAVCDSGICNANFRLTGTSMMGAIPEPATWAMMIVGFGAVGSSLRRRSARVRFA